MTANCSVTKHLRQQAYTSATPFSYSTGLFHWLDETHKHTCSSGHDKIKTTNTAIENTRTVYETKIHTQCKAAGHCTLSFFSPQT